MEAAFLDIEDLNSNIPGSDQTPVISRTALSGVGVNAIKWHVESDGKRLYENEVVYITIKVTMPSLQLVIEDLPIGTYDYAFRMEITYHHRYLGQGKWIERKIMKSSPARESYY